MKKVLVIIITGLTFLSGCTGMPMRLKSTADQAMHFLNAEMSTAIESMNHFRPIMTDAHQVHENKWCLTYELGPEFSFSSMWEKLEQTWIQTEIRPYVDDCNWAR
ncbi:MAG: hypothetical protein IH585_05850 [Anaerolineaceae bacterium]|nr:hypothetical protein [Anaerolineaceae bacterium]